MGLVRLEDVSDLLRCPSCHSTLIVDDAHASCTNSSCVHHEKRDGFPVVAGRWPAPIDFDRSIVARAALERATGPAGPDTGGTAGRMKRQLREVLSRTVRPENHVAAANVARLDSLLTAPHPLILVIGGGTVGNGLEALYANARFRILAFDIYPSPFVQFLSDAHSIPLADGQVDGVVIQAVLEHVLDPAVVVAEIHRVLAPGGVVYAETPFMQQVHAGPYDFTRFTDSGHRWLFRAFDQIDRGVVAGPGTALMWSLDHLARSLFRSRSAGRLTRLLFFWVRFADRVTDPHYAADAASAVFFLGRRADGQLRPRDMVDDYTGGQR